MTRVLSFSDGFTSASAPAGTAIQESYTIANNTTTGAILTLAQATNKSMFADYELRRVDSGGTFIQSGSFMMNYDGAWTMTYGNYQGDEMLVSTIANTEHVKLTLNSSTGILTYDSGNMVGTGYVGTLKLSAIRIS